MAEHLTLDGACEQRRCGPTQPGGNQNPVGTETVREPTARNQSECITKQEGAEHFAQRLVGEMKLGGHLARGYGNVDAVDVEHESDSAQDSDDGPTGVTAICSFPHSLAAPP
jgi:hypothetical protein